MLCYQRKTTSRVTKYFPETKCMKPESFITPRASLLFFFICLEMKTESGDLDDDLKDRGERERGREGEAEKKTQKTVS